MKEEISEDVYLRVTTPLARYSNYSNIPLHILENAADRGTRVHQYCELYASNMLFEEIDEDCSQYVNAFKIWFDENVIEVISLEKRLYCHDIKLQGQSDMIARVKDMSDITLIDIKTSLNYSKSWNLQTAAYQYLCSVNDIDITDRLVLQLKKDATFKTYLFSASEYEFDRGIYFSILKAHRYFS